MLPMPLVIFLTVVIGLIGFLVFTRLSFKKWLDGVSAAQLAGDPGLICCVNALLVWEKPLKMDNVVKLFEKYCQVERMQERVVLEKWKWPYWEKVQNFKVRDHFVEHNEEMDEKSMQEFISKELSVPIDIAKPLWMLHFFNNYTRADGTKTSACMYKFHHAMADGFAMMRLIFSECQFEGEEAKVPDQFKPQSKPPRAKKGGILKLIARGFESVGKLLLLPNDTMSVFKPDEFIDPSDPKHASWHDLQLSVIDIKRIGYATGSTVNDVLMAALSGALRMWAVNDKKLREEEINDLMTVIWVSLQPLTNVYKPPSKENPLIMGNRNLACVYSSFPLGDMCGYPTLNPILRLREMKTRLDQLKGTPEPLVGHALQSTVGKLPPALALQVWNNAAFKTSLSCSNLAGPQRPMRFAGEIVETIAVWVPPQGLIHNFVLIMSYNNKVCISFGASETLFKPDDLAKVNAYMDIQLKHMFAVACTQVRRESMSKETLESMAAVS